MPSGRFAPSPTGRLHLGNLRTALIAWLFARSDTSPFYLRFEDLDHGSVRQQHYGTQTDDLAALGLRFDGPVLLQSERRSLYDDALSRLQSLGATYPCFCSRREIREASQAPNRPIGGHLYPGTCRNLSPSERAAKTTMFATQGRSPATRLRVTDTQYSFVDAVTGRFESPIDDFVVRRGDGTPSYQVAVVVDDAAQGVELVVRGDDLLDSTGRQAAIYKMLELPVPRFAHVPLALNTNGDRLAKRDGSVTLADRAETPAQVLSWLGSTLGLCGRQEPVTADSLLDRFNPSDLPRYPWVLTTEDCAPSEL